MRFAFIDRIIDYNGSQLRSNFCKEVTGIKGDIIVSFIGKAAVKEHMVDIEDKKNKEYIYSDKMLHFLVEHFDKDLEKTILRKRLLLSIIMQEINSKAKKNVLVRKDNGLYDKQKKLTVAVATSSLKSTLIHIGLNIVRTGAPIKVACLSDYNIVPKSFAKKIMKMYVDEMHSIKLSQKKVKSVK